MVWSWKAHIQEEEFAEEEGVVDPFFDFVITQAVPGLKQWDLEHHQGIIGWIACGVLGLCILLVESCANTSPVNASADLSKERVLHVVATHLRINLQEARSGFGLFGRHSYMTVLVMKGLNIRDIRSNHNPVHL